MLPESVKYKVYDSLVGDGKGEIVYPLPLETRSNQTAVLKAIGEDDGNGVRIPGCSKRVYIERLSGTMYVMSAFKPSLEDVGAMICAQIFLGRIAKPLISTNKRGFVEVG